MYYFGTLSNKTVADDDWTEKIQDSVIDGSLTNKRIGD